MDVQLGSSKSHPICQDVRTDSAAGPYPGNVPCSSLLPLSAGKAWPPQEGCAGQDDYKDGSETDVWTRAEATEVFS